MIRSFADDKTERLWSREEVKELDPRILSTALRKLRVIDAALTLDDLRSPPGNWLELLRGDRRGEHGIRVNDQCRVCFIWRNAGTENVEIVDYH